jgi:hypothetical protein
MHSLPVNVDWSVTNELSAIIGFFFFFFCTRSVFKRTFEETTVFNFKFAVCFCSRDVGRVDIG